MLRLWSEGRGRQIWPAVNLFLQSSTLRRNSTADINMQGTLSHTKRWWFIWTCESVGPCGPQLERAERPHPAAPASHVVATPPASLPFTKTPPDLRLPDTPPLLLRMHCPPAAALSWSFKNCVEQLVLGSSCWQPDAFLWWVYFYVCAGM